MALTRPLYLLLTISLLALSLGTSAREAPLPVDQAFGFQSQVGPEGARLIFHIAKGYHLYLDRLRIRAGSEGVVIGNPDIPEGEQVVDPNMGHTRMARGHVEILVPVVALPPSPQQALLSVSYQGCQEAGSCYPPQRITISLEGVGMTPSIHAAPLSECDVRGVPDTVDSRSEQCQIVDALKAENVVTTAISFLGMGLLLAFTPCIFPMIPILSGLIAGQGGRITTQRAFTLSLAYVLASALAYTLFGVLAGLFGHNLQATLQQPSVILGFSALFVVLALSMFGVFAFEMPGTLQNHLTALSNRQKRGTLMGSATMGFLSALIVGPCVAAPLAGALIYIGETGDAVFGGFALFCLGIGMGIPLLAIGTSAGSLLPKAGVWMDGVKSLFGFGLLGIALWLVGRITPSDLMLFLWGSLLILAAISLGALESLQKASGMIPRLGKGFGIILLAYGILLLIGAATKGSDPFHPLEKLSIGHPQHANTQGDTLIFRPVRSVAELDAEIRNAKDQKKPVMLDFYADWCTSCLEMEAETFKDPDVIEALKDVILLKADVTEQNEADKVLLRRFGLIGPPATLFFREGDQEIRHHRIVGFMEPTPFISHVTAALGMGARLTSSEDTP